jgi:thymidylate kinase
LHDLIDWLMPLPDDLKIQFRKQLQQRLPEKTMPHITLFEELALEKGLVEGRQEGIVQTAREAILDVLDTRFGQVPESLRERVNAINGERNLKDLHRRAILTPSLEAFQAAL